MLFLVDGYNVTRRDPATAKLPLAAQREALVARLRVRGVDLLGSGDIVVVFDASEGSVAGDRASGRPTVVFAREGSADDEIVRRAAAAAGKVVVVSDDRELVERARVHARSQCESRPASCCFDGARSRGPSRRGRGGDVARDAGLPAGANEITRELKELWLGEQDGSDGTKR